MNNTIQFCGRLSVALAAFLGIGQAYAATTDNSPNQLCLVGDAAPYTWSLDDASALLTSNEQYVGTIYLLANKDFKFLTTFEWGGEEYGAAPDATLVDGEIALAKGSNDSGYGKIQVAEDGNYAIIVDTKEMKARIVKSDYQDTQINTTSLFMVGNATPGGWEVTDGTPLYQDQTAPYTYAASNQIMDEGSFKITRALKGGFDSSRWYFADASDATKVTTNSSGDNQWSIDEYALYNISVNLKDMTISTEKIEYPNQLCIVGDAAPFGWSLDDASALYPVDSPYSVYEGTLYLEADKDFKLLTTYSWGNTEYGAVDAGEVASDGDNVMIVGGTGDSGYNKIQVSESANYFIHVDLKTNVATFTKSSYQTNPVKATALFMVGGATPGGWAIKSGVRLDQSKDAPLQYSASDISLSEGSFKLIRAYNGDWDSSRWYYRDANNDAKVSTDSTDDRQWQISASDADQYDVIVDLEAMTINIKKHTTSIYFDEVCVEATDAADVEYYNLCGVRVYNPTSGLYIRRCGNNVSKVVLR